MSDAFIDYGKLIDDAMHVIVRHTLEKVAKEGLPGKHHFFISFLTPFPGVGLSEKLRQRYPEEMTIVLQYQFEELEVGEQHFSVVLSFDNVKERITIPFSALTAFADPSVKFGLQFRHLEWEEDSTESELESGMLAEEFSEPKAPAESAKKTAATAAETKKSSGKSSSKQKSSNSNVVKLDAFRNSHPKKKK